MRIYVLRHAIAEDQGSGKSDAARKLTPAGKVKLERVLERAGAAGVNPSLILSSPLTRALETAKIAAGILKYTGKVQRAESLAPGSTPERLWQEICARQSESAVLIAGHEPHLSTSVAYLLGAPQLEIDLKKAALVRLDIDNFDSQPKGVLKWLLTPALA